MFYYRHRLHKLRRKMHSSERIDRALLLGGLVLAVVFALDVALRSTAHAFLPQHLRNGLLWGLALIPVYAAIFEIYLNEKADRALIRQYQYMYSLFRFAAEQLRAASSSERKLEILRSLGHACLAEHAQWILAHRDKRIQGMRW
jgi:prolipoprotein diacylglyceryltransferase